MVVTAKAAAGSMVGSAVRALVGVFGEDSVAIIENTDKMAGDRSCEATCKVHKGGTLVGVRVATTCEACARD